jgi:hypothetical protein
MCSYKDLEEEKYKSCTQYVAGGTALNVARVFQVCVDLAKQLDCTW